MIQKTQLLFKYALGVLLTILAVYVVFRHWEIPWLWYDEAGQFWISRGLNHYSEPYFQPQGILEVIDNNRYYNLDPGGFSVLLHFWLCLSTNYVFIRLFPFLFFASFSFLFYLYIRDNTDSRYFAFICTILMYFSPVFVSRVVEVRAYSMELFGIMWALYLLQVCRKSHYSTLPLLCLSIGMALFCTSRYEYIIIAGIISLYVLFRIYQYREEWLYKSVLFGLPLIASLILIVLGTLRFQNPSINKLDYLDYLSDNPSLFYGRLFICYIINALLVSFSYYRNRSMTEIQFLSLTITTSFVLLSLAGRYPWDSIRAISIPILLFINLAIEVFGRIKKIYASIAVTIFMLIIIGGRPNYIYNSGMKMYREFSEAIEQKGDQTIYLDDWVSPSARYMYEYGCYSKRVVKDNYPDDFVFQRYMPNRTDRSKHGKYSDMPSQVKADIYLVYRHKKDVQSIYIQLPMHEYTFVRKDGKGY